MGQIFPNNNVLLSDFGWEIVQMVLVDMTKKSLVDYYMFIMRDTVKKYVLLVELKKNSQSKEMCQT